MGPLGLLLAVSRPRVLREYVWMAIALLATVAVLGQAPAGLADRTIRAAGLFFTGTYVSLAMLGGRSLFLRSMVSTAIATVFTTGWFIALQLRFDDLRSALVASNWASYRVFIRGLPEQPPGPGASVVGETAELARALAGSLQQIGDVFPAVIALTALAGGALAWVWYHRIATRSFGTAPGPFREFRFSDQLLWLLVITLAAALAPLPGAAHLVAKNLLVVALGLHAARGLAVLGWALARAPRFLAILLCFIAIPLLPFAVAGCLALGVADTWLDLRRRVPPTDGVTR